MFGKIIPALRGDRFRSNAISALCADRFVVDFWEASPISEALQAKIEIDVIFLQNRSIPKIELNPCRTTLLLCLESPAIAWVWMLCRVVVIKSETPPELTSRQLAAVSPDCM